MANGTKAPFMRSAYNYDVTAASNEAAIPADQQGKSLTIQSQAEDADINVLMRRYGITGKMPENPYVPVYGDFSGVSDYQTALHVVMGAQAGFMELPAHVRARFGNDPQQLLEFCNNGANRAEAIQLGLVNPSMDISVPPTAAPVAQREAVQGTPGAAPKAPGST